MSAIEPIASVAAERMAALLPDDLASPADLQPARVDAGFGALMTQGIQSVNEQLAVSQVDLQKLATGQAENLHEVMIRLEESRISFQLMMQVRARLLEAYQDIMKMQV